jgi:hypothetical protein
MNEPDFPGPRPVLDRFLALNCIANIVKVFIVDKAFQPVALRESFDDAFTMLERTIW